MQLVCKRKSYFLKTTMSYIIATSPFVKNGVILKYFNQQEVLFVFSCLCLSFKEFCYQNDHTGCLSFQTQVGYNMYSSFQNFYSKSKLPIDIFFFFYPLIFFFKEGYILKTVRSRSFFTLLLRLSYDICYRTIFKIQTDALHHYKEMVHILMKCIIILRVSQVTQW